MRRQEEDAAFPIATGLLNLPLKHATAHWPKEGNRSWKLNESGVAELYLLHYDADRRTAFLKVHHTDGNVQYGFFSGEQMDIDFLPLSPEDPRNKDIEAFIRDYKNKC